MRTEPAEIMELLERAAELEAMIEDAEDAAMLEPELRRIKGRIVALALEWARGATSARAAPLKEHTGRFAPLVAYFR